MSAERPELTRLQILQRILSPWIWIPEVIKAIDEEKSRNALIKTAEHFNTLVYPELKLEECLTALGLSTDPDVEYPFEQGLEAREFILSLLTVQLNTRKVQHGYFELLHFIEEKTYQPPRERIEKDVKKESELTFGEIYADFLKRENREAESSDLYVLDLNQDSPEWQALSSVASTEELSTQQFFRATLQKAGYVFVNKYRGWEKPLFRVEIDEVNYDERVLLTQAELNIILRWQQEQGYGLPEDVESEKVRREMIEFMLACDAITAPDMNSSYAYFLASKDLKKRLNKVGARLITQWEEMQGLTKDLEYSDAEDKRREIVDSNFKLEYPWIVPIMMVGIPIRDNYASANAKRAGILAGLNSPFLDSGFQFFQMLDVQLNLARLKTVTKPAMRINLMVWHLWGRGVSEIGDGKETGSWDQHYATLAEYYEHVYSEDVIQKKVEEQAFTLKDGMTKDALLDSFEDRLWKIVQQWANAYSDETRQQLSQVEWKKHERFPS